MFKWYKHKRDFLCGPYYTVISPAAQKDSNEQKNNKKKKKKRLKSKESKR